MPVHPHPGVGPTPEDGDHNLKAARQGEQPETGIQEPAARGDGRLANPGDGGTDGASLFAHGTHGRGDSREVMNDRKAVDSGDRESSRRAGAGPDEAPDPTKFAKDLDGRMDGAGWGSESVGGSAVDRRQDEHKG